MTRKMITTKDANGCEFQVLCLYGSTLSHEFVGNKVVAVKDCDYYAHGLHTKTLQEMKQKVSEI